mmetsp:Transcript_15133/g.27412  ORF Transcript_15133/g.27412 Transcript_15133/m.27412 type:complete len:220 (+) Transcript_15133:2306-2965(+)
MTCTILILYITYWGAIASLSREYGRCGCTTRGHWSVDGGSRNATIFPSRLIHAFYIIIIVLLLASIIIVYQAARTFSSRIMSNTTFKVIFLGFVLLMIINVDCITEYFFITRASALLLVSIIVYRPALIFSNQSSDNTTSFKVIFLSFILLMFIIVDCIAIFIFGSYRFCIIDVIFVLRHVFAQHRDSIIHFLDPVQLFLFAAASTGVIVQKYIAHYHC